VWPRFFDTSVLRTVYTTRVASGDSAGLPTRSMLTRSSMVKPRGAAMAPVAATRAVPSISKRNFIRSSCVGELHQESHLCDWCRPLRARQQFNMLQ
jgi:hypothetical protein